MGCFWLNVSTPALVARFKIAYNISPDVCLTLADEGVIPDCTPTSVPFQIQSIIQGGIRFPLPPLFLEFFSVTKLIPSQLSINAIRIVGSAIALNSLLGINLGLPEIFACYSITGKRDGSAYALRHKKFQVEFLFNRPDSDKHGKDFFIVSGNFEYLVGQRPGRHTVPRRPGVANKNYLNSLGRNANLEYLRKVERFANRTPEKLLGYTPRYRTTINRKKRSSLPSYFGCEINLPEPASCSSSGSALIHSSQSLVSSDLSEPEMPRQEFQPEQLVPRPNRAGTSQATKPSTGSTIARPPISKSTHQRNSAVLATPAAGAVDRTQKRKRPSGQDSDIQSGSHPKSAENAVNWKPSFKVGDRPMNTNDSVKKVDVALQLAKAVLLPADADPLVKASEINQAKNMVSFAAQLFQRALVNHDKVVEHSKKMSDAGNLLETQREKISALKQTLKDAKKTEQQANKKVADLEKKLADLEDSHNAAIDEADAAGYSAGITVATEKFTKQVIDGLEDGFKEGWVEALKKAGVEEGNELFNNIPVPDYASFVASVPDAATNDTRTETQGIENPEVQTPAEDQVPEGDRAPNDVSPGDTFAGLAPLSDASL